MTAALPPLEASAPAVGISAAEAARQLGEYGPNDPAPSRRRSGVVTLLLLFLNPLAIVLLIAAVFSAFLGQFVDASIIVLMVVLGIVINFAQTYRSQRAVERLSEHVLTTASVLRDGAWQEGDKTGTLTSAVMERYESVDLFGCRSDHVFELRFLNSKFETGLRNPLNLAMLERPHPEFDDYQKCSEVPFDFERRCISAIVERNDVRQLITKGAPKSVIQRCALYQSAEGTKPLSDEIRAAAEKTFHELSSHGFRILSVAYGVVDRRPPYSPADEANLVLSGYLVFSDPPGWTRQIRYLR